MSISYTFSVFVKELPGYVLFAGIFMPVTLLLLLLIVYFRTKLLEDEELDMAQDPTKTLLNYQGQWQKPRRSGQKEKKGKNQRAFKGASGSKLKPSTRLCRFKNNHL